MSSAAVFTAVVLLCTSLRGASTEAIHKPSFENLGELHQREGNAMSAALDEATARIRLQNALAASLQKASANEKKQAALEGEIKDMDNVYDAKSKECAAIKAKFRVMTRDFADVYDAKSTLTENAREAFTQQYNTIKELLGECMKELDSTAKDNTMVTSEHKRSLASLVKAAAAIMKETDAIKLDVKKTMEQMDQHQQSREVDLEGAHGEVDDIFKAYIQAAKLASAKSGNWKTYTDALMDMLLHLKQERAGVGAAHVTSRNEVEKRCGGADFCEGVLSGYDAAVGSPHLTFYTAWDSEVRKGIRTHKTDEYQKQFEAEKDNQKFLVAQKRQKAADEGKTATTETRVRLSFVIASEKKVQEMTDEEAAQVKDQVEGWFVAATKIDKDRIKETVLHDYDTHRDVRATVVLKGTQTEQEHNKIDQDIETAIKTDSADAERAGSGDAAPFVVVAGRSVVDVDVADASSSSSSDAVAVARRARRAVTTGAASDWHQELQCFEPKFGSLGGTNAFWLQSNDYVGNYVSAQRCKDICDESITQAPEFVCAAVQVKPGVNGRTCSFYTDVAYTSSPKKDCGTSPGGKHQTWTSSRVSAAATTTAAVTTTAAENARQWRQIAWSDLKNARAAQAAAEDPDPSWRKEQLEQVKEAASLAVQKAASSQAARETADAKAAEAAAAAAKIETAKECVSSQNKPINCLVSSWSDYDKSQCSDMCDAGGTVQRTRTIKYKDMCGGTRCPPLVETTACPAVPTCVFSQKQAIRATLKLHGVSTKLYTSNKEAVQLALKAAYGEAMEKGPPFQLRFKAHNLASTPTEGYARRRRAALPPAATDTELVFDFETDGADITSEQSAAFAKNVSSDDIGGKLSSIPPVRDALTDVFVDNEVCTIDEKECKAETCGWVVDSCGSTRWCGDCGLEALTCGHALTACINDGDCSHMSGVLDKSNSLDECLKDTSQLNKMIK